MINEIELIRNIIVCYLGSSNNTNGLVEMMLVKKDDKALLEHINALLPIFIRAKKKLEKKEIYK